MKALVESLIKRNLTLTSCESLTGGLFASNFTGISGASKVFRGGLVVYNNEAKTKLAKVSPQVLQKHGAISEQCAKEMAQNTRQLLDTDLAISFTGNAGPDQQENKPIGLVFIGFATKRRSIVKLCQFQGSREGIRRQAITVGIELIKENFSS